FLDFTHFLFPWSRAGDCPDPPRAQMAGVSRKTCTSVFTPGKYVRTTSNQFAASFGKRPRWLPHLAQRSSAACGPLRACTTPKLMQHPFLRSVFRSSLRRSPCCGDASASSDRHGCFTVASLVARYGNPADVAASAFPACIHTSASEH